MLGDMVRRIALLLALLGASTAAAEESLWPAIGAPKPLGGGEKDAALIAGVDRYAFVEPVPGARQNAEAWSDYLVQGRRVPAERVRLLRDQEVTAEKLLRFAAEAAREVQPGGVLWFVFIGHGAPGKDGSGLLVGVDAQPEVDSLQQRSVSQSQILEALEGSPAARVVVLIDACFSGRAPSGKPLVERLQPIVAEAVPRAEPRLTLLTAAASNEYAGPLRGLSRPPFSYLVLGGLRGWADADGDGKVTAGELRTYAARTIRMLATDRRQNPTLHGGAEVVLGNAWEKGPDLGALARGSGAPDPVEVAPPALPSLPKQIPIEALEAFDRAVKLEKVGSPTEISEAWTMLEGIKGENPYRGYAQKKNEWWLAAARHAPAEWEKLKRLVAIDVVSMKEKAEAVKRFRAGFGTMPGYGRRARDVEGVVQNASACAAGKQRGCVGLAWSLHLGRGAVRNDERAQHLFREACDGGEPRGCAGLAHLYEQGASVPKRLDKALALYERSCKKRVWSACVGAAAMLEEGRGVPAKPEAAAKRYKVACKKREGTGCLRYGKWLEKKGDARSLLLARKAFEKACHLGALKGCTTVAFLHAEGRGVPRDRARAVRLYQDACDRGEMRACFKLGELHFYGLSGENTTYRATELFENACDGGDAAACAAVGWLAERQGGELSRAAQLYEGACREGAMQGCVGLGRLLATGRSLPRDEKRALALFQQACDGQDRWGCKKLGDAYRDGLAGVAADDAKTQDAYERACRLGEMRGCFHRGLRLWDNNPANQKKAAAYFEQACEGGVIRGCDDLAQMVEQGEAGARDPARARALYRRGCDRFLARSCFGLARSILADPNASPSEKAEAPKLMQTACRFRFIPACKPPPPKPQ
jgi:TPR repeat protein